ncbi:MAG: polysaccharide biosynthesis tyrosine autokinase [Kosmotoga sp.]|nr:MAG: polysaccharide biosynthesis tyrosine autokinase [Kosmotoga sp.]
MDENSQDYRELTLEDILRMFRKRWKIFLLVVIAVVVITGVYLLFATPIYEASVTMKVEGSSKASLNTIFMDSVSGGFSSQNISTEIELIKSRSNLEKVVDKLNLIDKMIDQEKINELLNKGKTMSDIQSSLVKTLGNIVTVSPVKDTSIVRISVQHEDPVLAKKIANTLAEVYNEKLAELARRDIAMRKNFIESQIPTLEKELNEATNALREYKEETGIYVLNEQAKWVLQMLSKYDEQYNSLQIQLEETLAEKESYGRLLDEFDSSEAEEIKQKWIKTSESLSRNPILSQLKSKLVDLKIELASLRQQYTESDPKVVAKKTEIAETEKLISEQTKEFILTGENQTLNPVYQEILTGIISSESKIHVLEARSDAVEKLRKEYEDQLSTLPKIEQKLLELQRKVTIKEKLYTLFLEKLEEAKIEEAAVVGNAAVVDSAIVPNSPVKPNKKLSLAIGGVLGIFLGMLAVFLMEYLDKTLKTEEEIERYSGEKIIGRIPLITEDELTNELVVKNNPVSPQAEAIKLAAGNIGFMLQDNKILGITSVTPGEGKTFISANIAYAFALKGNRTLLIDFDMRRPRVEKMLKLRSVNGSGELKGIADLLTDDITLDEAIIHYDENLDVIPHGNIPPNPTILLSSRKLDEQLKLIKERYDKIIVDTPPALITSDVSQLAHKLDGLSIVVRPGLALRDGLKISTQNLKNIGVNIFGIIINGAEKHSSSYYYYYYYSEKGKKKRRRKTKNILDYFRGNK